LDCERFRDKTNEQIVSEYEYGYDPVLHCKCHICELTRYEKGLELCCNNSCNGCKNRISGKKIHNLEQDLYKKVNR